MKALSIKQPYAYLILVRAYEDDARRPLKPVENRSKPLPTFFDLPQRIWVHAGLSLSDVELPEIEQKMSATQWLRCRDTLRNIYQEYAYYHNNRQKLQSLGHFGCLLGTIVITGQMRKTIDPTFASLAGSKPSIGDIGRELRCLAKENSSSLSPWFVGPYGYIFEYPEKLLAPIPYRGALGFFEVDDLV